MIKQIESKNTIFFEFDKQNWYFFPFVRISDFEYLVALYLVEDEKNMFF